MAGIWWRRGKAIVNSSIRPSWPSYCRGEAQRRSCPRDAQQYPEAGWSGAVRKSCGMLLLLKRHETTIWRTAGSSRMRRYWCHHRGNGATDPRSYRHAPERSAGGRVAHSPGLLSGRVCRGLDSARYRRQRLAGADSLEQRRTGFGGLRAAFGPVGIKNKFSRVALAVVGRA